MIFLILTIILISVSFLSNHLFKKWFNHLFLYTLIWYLMLVLYELKLMQFSELSSLTWMAVAAAYFSFVCGVLLVYLARQRYSLKYLQLPSRLHQYEIFSDGGHTVQRAIILISIIGILSAIQQWFILIKMYGSLPAIFLNANEVYRLRVEGKIEGVIPYIPSISFVGVFLSGVYVANTRKITLVSMLPIFAVILKELANFGRADMMSALFLFTSSFILFKYSLPSEGTKILKSKIKVIVTVSIIFTLIIAGAGLVRSTRGTIESFSASSQKLNELKGNFFITPSLYLYACSHIGVLNKYLELDYDNRNFLGEITFQPIYNFLSKFGVVRHPPFYDKGYYIPMWTNTGTYLKPLFEDFGPLGIYLGPFSLGLFASLLWFNFFEKKSLISLIYLSYFYVLIMFSFLTMFSRSGIWLIGLLLTHIIIILIRKIVARNSVFYIS
jgi:oligosaccharide repeat unit polymerase